MESVAYRDLVLCERAVEARRTRKARVDGPGEDADRKLFSMPRQHSYMEVGGGRRTVIVYLTMICLFGFPRKPHRSAISFSMAPFGSFSRLYTIERGNLKEVSELPANAILFVSPPPASTPVEGYQAFALSKALVSGVMIAGSERKTNLIFSKLAVKELGFLTLRKG